MPTDPTEGDERWMRQQCINCGHSRGSHCATEEKEWCPEHEGKQDWSREMWWVPGGRFLTDEEISALKGNADR